MPYFLPSDFNFKNPSKLFSVDINVQQLLSSLALLFLLCFIGFIIGLLSIKDCNLLTAFVSPVLAFCRNT